MHINYSALLFTYFQYDALPDSVSKRLVFATAAMHAYAHQWSCQIGYNPRMKTGIGLTDGEGVERLWSRLRKLIGIMRWLSVGTRMEAFVSLTSVQRERRLIILDRQFVFISGAIREDLPRWLRRRTTAVTTKRFDALTDLAASGHSIEYARSQWALQRASDLSVQSRESDLHRVLLHLNSSRTGQHLAAGAQGRAQLARPN